MPIVYTDDTHYKNIAQSIRLKNKSDQEYRPEEMSAAIDEIPVVVEGGIDTSDATATAADIFEGQTAYVNGKKITGIMSTAKLDIPLMNVDQNGNVIVTARVTSGRSFGDAVTETLTLDAQEAKTITPSTENQIAVESYKYTIGQIKVIGDENLTPENIKKDVNIFGVKGEYFGLDTSDATASGFDISEGKTAYKNGSKITGTLADYTEGKTYSCVANADPTYIDGTIYSISSNSTILSDVILRKDSTISMLAKAESFGDANPEDVLAGRTFTSSAGLKITGTASSDVGVDTYDATATKIDIAKGKTAYVNGEKVTGTLNDISAGILQMDTVTPEEYAGVYYSVSDFMSEDAILRKGVEVKITMNKDLFGDATSDDVIFGRTFTSANGLTITGAITNAEEAKFGV